MRRISRRHKGATQIRETGLVEKSVEGGARWEGFVTSNTYEAGRNYIALFEPVRPDSAKRHAAVAAVERTLVFLPLPRLAPGAGDYGLRIENAPRETLSLFLLPGHTVVACCPKGGRATELLHSTAKFLYHSAHACRVTSYG